ncbi:K(+) efflux antiporter 6 isoform X2 [Gossypium hirsutum]|uniref:K(+) efflux antiporter 6 isoform X2 n=1 Tax=Gossypium hirsutum TaxID=3635 RepID=A0A1U8PPW3_GOSHI|nr:K(+) efflux antiporter 6 isoform X2 [Gossypium hirsutum]
MLRKSNSSLEILTFCFFVSLFCLASFSVAQRQQEQLAESDRFDDDDDGGNGTVSNASSIAKPKDGTFAAIIDRALEKEFTENEQNEVNDDAGSFNNSVVEKKAVLETVARVKTKKNDTKEEKSFQLHDVFNLENDNRAEDTPMLIDRKDNVFIISNFKSKYPVLQLDLRLISDLVVVIVSATCGGIAFACAGQPVITGYLLAGSLIGPGGFNFVSEMVQVETVAQFGVIFLLFALGLEFSIAKLRVVRAVAVLGGLLQIVLFMCLCGITASLCGGRLSEGVFVGVFLSMSSTAVVLKFLMEKNSNNMLHGQVIIGTLILQDCAVGLLFALLPVLVGTSGIFQGVISMTKLLVMLATFLGVLSILSRTGLPWLLKLMISLSSQTDELYQLASVAFCLLVAWIEPIRNFFAALFLASIGMLIHVHFLWNHVDILLASVILVITIKTIIIALVVKGFGYNNKTSLLVGMSLAQIGEFAFVLLSRASNIHLVEGKLYLLLLGTTALSLVTSPLLFKLIPALLHLGVLLRWFSPERESPIEVGIKGDNLRSDSGKHHITLMVQEPHDS